MQLVSLAITSGADKVKGPADIPSFTKAMPLYYEASRSAAIDFFLTPILGTDEHVGEIPYLAKEHGITSSNCTYKCRGRGSRVASICLLTTVAFTRLSNP